MNERPRTGLRDPLVAQAVADATEALRANTGDKVAASVLWLADRLDQANLSLSAALGREDERETA